MHEIGIATEVLRIVGDTARAHGIAVVKSVTLEVGKLSGVDREALEFALQVIAPGSLLERAEILTVVPDLELRCRGCGRGYTAEVDSAICPGCGAAEYEVLSGYDMLVRSVTGE